MQAVAAITSMIVALWSRLVHWIESVWVAGNEVYQTHISPLPKTTEYSWSTSTHRDELQIKVVAEQEGSISREQYCFDTVCVDLEIADTQSARSYWLMFREDMPELSGMMFVFKEPWINMFWMKNTLLPLDILWVDKSGIVIDIQKADPCTQDPCDTYWPHQESLYVVELNQGISDKYRIVRGSHIQWPRFSYTSQREKEWFEQQ